MRLADVEGDCFVNMSVHVPYFSFDWLPAQKRLLCLTIDSLASGSESIHLNSMALCLFSLVLGPSARATFA